MAFILEKQESLEEGAKRIMTEEMDGVMDALRMEDVHKGIHEARKGFKRIRALLRLFRKEFGNKAFQMRNHYFRDESRKLSRLRDYTVMLELLEKLEEHFNEKSLRDAILQSAIQLEKDREHWLEDGLKAQNVLGRMVVGLEQNRQELLHFSFGPRLRRNFERSLRKVYRRGWKGFHRVLDHPSGENFHEWRKRVKYLFFHFQLLHDLWPPIMKAWEQELSTLQDELGEYHDQDVLRTFLQSGRHSLNDHQQQMVVHHLHAIQDNMRPHLYHLGYLLYTESPPDFATRITSYYDIWRS